MTTEPLASVQKELELIRELVGESQSNVAQLTSKCDALNAAVVDLSGSIDKLRLDVKNISAAVSSGSAMVPAASPTLAPADPEDVQKIRAMIIELAENLGGAIHTLHRDFVYVVEHHRTAIAEVRTHLRPVSMALAGVHPFQPPQLQQHLLQQQQQQEPQQQAAPVPYQEGTDHYSPLS